MRTLTPADHAALRAMQQAARKPKGSRRQLPRMSALRAGGVDHEEAIERAMECIMEDARMDKPN